jgi:DNA-binding PadR family transcriptional regulator
MKRERHGYEIHRSGLRRARQAGISQISALLKRLEAAGKTASAIEMQKKRRYP